jgi:hypothetical protein
MMATEPSFDPYDDVLEELDATPAASHLRASDRLGASIFVIPDTTTMLHARCPACSGNTYASHGEIHCMMCCRRLHVLHVSDTGRIMELSILHTVPKLSRAGYGERARAARGVARQANGQIGLAARVLSCIPDAESPEYAVVERLARRMAVTREDIRDVLAKLEHKGLVERFSFRGGYRVGWRRTRRTDR